MATRSQGGGDTHECDQCGESFPTEQELQQHVGEAHPAVDRQVPSETGSSRTDGGAGMVQTE